MTNESAQNLKKLVVPVRNESGRELDRIVFRAALGDKEIVIEGKFEVKIIKKTLSSRAEYDQSETQNK